MFSLYSIKNHNSTKRKILESLIHFQGIFYNYLIVSLLLRTDVLYKNKTS